MGDENDLTNRIGMTRRNVLKVLGAGATAAGVGTAATNDDGTLIQSAAFTSDLSEQYYRDKYATAPEAAFDASQLQTGERYWITDTGELGVKTESGTESPPIGSSSQPVPAVHTEVQNNTIHWVPSGSTPAEITSIINDAGSNSRIFFEGGDYPTQTEPIRVDSLDNVELVGPGWGTEFKVADGEILSNIEIVGAASDDKSQNISIHGFFFNGNKDNVPDGESALDQCGIFTNNVRGLEIHNNYAYNHKYSNIRVSRCPKAQIHHNRAELTEPNDQTADLPTDNISIKNEMDAWSIDHNLCLDCGHQAIEVSTNSRNGVVANNYVENAYSASIQTHFDARVAVVNNVVVDGQSNGLFIGDPESPVANNIIHNVAGAGIRIKESSTTQVPIVGNVITNPSTHGIRIDDVSHGIIVGLNSIDGAAGEGVKIGGTGGSLSTAIVGMNYIRSCRNAVDLIENRNSRVSHNILQNNDTGVRVDSDCVVVDLSGNSFESNTTDIDDSGSRSSFNRVLGGGRLGGVDMGTTTGFYDGQEGLADGTTSTKFLKGVWDDANSQWVMSDGTVV